MRRVVKVRVLTTDRTWLNFPTALSFMRMVGYHALPSLATRALSPTRKGKEADAETDDSDDGQPLVIRRVGDQVKTSLVASSYKRAANGSVASRLSADKLLAVWAGAVRLEFEVLAAFDSSPVDSSAFGCFGVSADAVAAAATQFIRYVAVLSEYG